MDVSKNECAMLYEKTDIPFEPETNIEEIEVTEAYYKKLFPQDDSVDFKKLRLSNIGAYSITNPKVSKKIVEHILSDLKSSDKTVTDAFGNMGGMTISLAKVFSKVNTCEIVKEHCSILKNNIDVYGLSEKVDIKCGDYMDYMNKLKQDAIMFDPPWGGLDYKKIKEMPLSLNNINICCIIDHLLPKTKFIYMLVPPNYKFSDLKLINKKYKIKKVKLEPERGKKSKILLVFSGHLSAGSRITRRQKKRI